MIMKDAKHMHKNLVITSMDEQIRSWITNFLSKPNPLLNNFPPCPFAKKALLDERVQIKKFTEWDELSHVAADWDDSLDVALWWFADRDLETMNNVKLQFNNVWRPHDMWLLMDHPDKHELINGVEMNFKLAGLLLLQRYSTLVDASETLKTQGYYKTWNATEQAFVHRRNLNN